MKRSLLAVGSAFAVALLMSGCAGVATNNGGVAPVSAGPNFYTEVASNAILQPIAGNDYTVVKRDVKASAKLILYLNYVPIAEVPMEKHMTLYDLSFSATTLPIIMKVLDIFSVVVMAFFMSLVAYSAILSSKKKKSKKMKSA